MHIKLTNRSFKASTNALLKNQQRRITKHEKLIKMINQYQSSLEQQQRLSRIRKNTILQIDIRFRNSQISKHYSFPRTDFDIKESPNESQLSNNIKGICHYNLHSQNLIEEQEQKRPNMALGRRIKSLDHDSPRQFLRKDNNLDIQYGEANTPALRIQRSYTQPKNLKSNLVLPPLKKKPSILKTQIIPQKDMFAEVLSKKLITEQNTQKLITKQSTKKSITEQSTQKSKKKSQFKSLSKRRK